MRGAASGSIMSTGGIIISKTLKDIQRRDIEDSEGYPEAEYHSRES